MVLLVVLVVVVIVQVAVVLVHIVQIGIMKHKVVDNLWVLHLQ